MVQDLKRAFALGERRILELSREAMALVRDDSIRQRYALPTTSGSLRSRLLSPNFFGARTWVAHPTKATGDATKVAVETGLVFVTVALLDERLPQSIQTRLLADLSLA